MKNCAYCKSKDFETKKDKKTGFHICKKCAKRFLTRDHFEELWSGDRVKLTGGQINWETMIRAEPARFIRPTATFTTNPIPGEIPLDREPEQPTRPLEPGEIRTFTTRWAEIEILEPPPED